MKKLWIFLLGATADLEVALFMPLVAGLILLFAYPKISQMISIYIAGVKLQNILNLVVFLGIFILWGAQGLIYTLRKEFPILFPPLSGKVAIFWGAFFTCLCFAFALRSVYLIIIQLFEP